MSGHDFMKRLQSLLLIAFLATLCGCAAHKPVAAPTLAPRRCPAGYDLHKAMYHGQLIDICARPDPATGVFDIRVPGDIPGDDDEPDEGGAGKPHWWQFWRR